MYLTIAIHHPHPEHVADFTAYMQRVRAATGDPPGLIEFGGWRGSDGTTLAGVATWESEQAFRDALPLIGSIRHERAPEWSERPDELLTFESF
jgi:hypothetical protein